ncbi:hypothetical protein DYB35_003560, partial [Aphanomyces astaci]
FAEELWTRRNSHHVAADMSDSDSDLQPLRKKVKKTSKVSKVRADADDDSDFDDDQPLTKLKAPKKSAKVDKTASKPTAAKKTSPVKKASAKKVSAKDSKTKTAAKKKPAVKVKAEAGSVRKLKVQSKSERLDMAIKAYRWWNAEELPEGIQWRSLEHNGVLFPPSYEPHGIPVLYDGVPVTLTPEQEEIASFFAAMPADGPQLGNPKTAAMFTKNFFADFKASLGKNHVIKDIKKCNFEKIQAHLTDLVRRRPSSRGEHPKTGTLKKAVLPEEVTINVGMEDRVPPCLTPGHAWKEVIHRDTVSWLAYWNENVMGGIKYVWLAASSSFKGKADMEKYEKARRLKNCIAKIRKDYTDGLTAKDMFTRQRSTAMWVIDVLALRVGNEKGEDEADTVGCCSLRVEHASFNATNCELTLSFLGKDSMPYNNTIQLAVYGTVGEQVFNNLKSFCAKKEPHQDIFHELSVTELNKHLSSLMPGLSAKVFRTFNASVTLEKELPRVLPGDDVAVKIVSYNDANRKVAILCNHQRSVPKGFGSTVDKMNATLSQLNDQLNELQAMRVAVKKNKPKAIQLRQDDADDADDADAKKAQLHRFTKVPTNEVPISAVFPKALREKFVWSMDVDSNWSF